MQIGRETDNRTGRVMDSGGAMQRFSVVPALCFYKYQEYDAV